MDHRAGLGPARLGLQSGINSGRPAGPGGQAAVHGGRRDLGLILHPTGSPRCYGRKNRALVDVQYRLNGSHCGPGSVTHSAPEQSSADVNGIPSIFAWMAAPGCSRPGHYAASTTQQGRCPAHDDAVTSLAVALSTCNPYGPLCANTTSFINPEVRSASQSCSCQSRTDPPPYAPCTES